MIPAKPDITFLITLAFALCVFSLSAQANTIEQLLAQYSKEANMPLNADNGKTLWHKTYTDSKSQQRRSCTSCHTAQLTNPGKHKRTGKVIKPMAVSVNPSRYSKAKKVEKWFKRNCKWTMGRECTAKEKGDILLYLSNQ